MDQFIGDPLIPDTATCDPARMAAGEPGLPRRFTWRGETVEIVAVQRAWRETSKCRHASGENYAHKHWYEVATANHGIWRVYFERHNRGGAKGARWWLYSMFGNENTLAVDGLTPPASATR